MAIQKRNFFKFILVGWLTVLAGEYQVNVLVLHKGTGAYGAALLLYAFILTLMYLFGELLERKISPKNIDVLYYVIGGLVGLAIEWFIIGNAPWVRNGSIQTGMFAWWGAVFLVPWIFTSRIDAVTISVRRRIFITLFIYSLVSLVIVTLVPAILRPAIAAILITISYIILNFNFIPYLAHNGYSRTLLRMGMWFLVLAGILNFLF